MVSKLQLLLCSIILFGLFLPILILSVTSNFILAIYGTLATFLSAEIFFRILIVRELKFDANTNINTYYMQSLTKPKGLNFKPHPYALYVKQKYSKGEYPTNNLGYVGKRDIATEKQDGKIRIYCVGGSTVEGIDLLQGPDSHWPAKMQDILNKSMNDTMIEVINAGMSGYTSAESLAEFLFRGIDLKPNILLIYHNINDAWTVQMVDGFRNDYSHARLQKSWVLHWINYLPMISFSVFYQLFRNEIVNVWAKQNALIYQVSNPPWVSKEEFDIKRVKIFKRNIRNLVNIAKTNSILPVLVKWEFDWDSNYNPPYYLGDKQMIQKKFLQYVNANNESLKQLSEECKISYFDVGSFSSDCFKDDIHFNAKGLDEMAYRIAQNIQPIIAGILK